MLNLHKLEQRWLRYKIKSYLPYVVITISIVTIITTLTLFLKESKKEVLPKKKHIEKKVLPHPKEKREKMHSERQPNHKNKKNHPKKEKKNIVKKEKTKHITIIKENNYSDIAKIIHRFNKNNNPLLSLFVAKRYYKLGKYREARNYALITNNINQNIEASWLIFSKSLVKLGEKKKAISTLQKYIEYSHSHSATILLDEIRSGKFNG